MAAPKERFELLYANLKYYRDSSIDSVFKVAGFLIIVAGWLVTSKDGRAFLASNLLTRIAAVTVILAIAVVYTAIAMRVMRHSRLTFDRLKQLDYMPVETFKEVLIEPYMIVPFVLINTVISVAISLFVLQLT